MVDGQLTRQFSLSHNKTRMTLSRWHITRAKQFPIIQSSLLSNQIITGLFKICRFWIFILIYIKLYPLIDSHLNTPDLSQDPNSIQVFLGNPFVSFSVNLPTNQQANKQTNMGEIITSLARIIGGLGIHAASKFH